jgi:hypothetical protein
MRRGHCRESSEFTMRRRRRTSGTARRTSGRLSDGERAAMQPRRITPSNTLFPRRGLRPLATAGGVISLRERRWTPLRRPDGRLSGRRKTQNVGGNGRERQTDFVVNGSRRVAAARAQGLGITRTARLRGSLWLRAPTSANMRLPRRRFAPCHRGWGCRSRVKGGGHAFAALTVGSRRVGKH